MMDIEQAMDTLRRWAENPGRDCNIDSCSACRPYREASEALTVVERFISVSVPKSWLEDEQRDHRETHEQLVAALKLAP